TQLSVGAFCVDAIARHFLPADVASALRPLHASVAGAVGLAALGASVFHLGRPLYAFRAVLGVRTSWMSREIIAFGVFAPLAIAYAASAVLHARMLELLPPALVTRVTEGLLSAVAAAGLAGIFCSAMIYDATKRAFWSGTSAAFKFFTTAAIVGIALTLLTFTAGATVLGGEVARQSVAGLVPALSALLAGVSALKLV